MELPLAYYRDPVLRRKTAKVNGIDDELRQLVADMIETLHVYDGVGIAAPQVHHSLALFITCVPTQRGGKWSQGSDRVFINPQILETSQETQVTSEGCLSIPNLYLNIIRPKKITIQAVDMEGNPFQETFKGFEAANFLHEYDHLNGILIVDRLEKDERKELISLFQTSQGVP